MVNENIKEAESLANHDKVVADLLRQGTGEDVTSVEEEIILLEQVRNNIRKEYLENLLFKRWCDELIKSR